MNQKLNHIYTHRFLRGLFLSIIIFFSISGTSFSQDFEVAPVRVVFNAVPGESQNRSVTVKNHSNRREIVSLRIRDFLVLREGQTETLEAGSTRNSIAPWVTINPSFLELEPNESRSVQLTLQAPVDDFSSKWGILSFFTTAEQTVFSADRELAAGVAVSGRIDINLAYNPASNDPGRMEINNLVEIDSNDPNERKFQVNIDNLSERIITGRVFLISSNLVTGDENRFRTQEVVVYPQTTRSVVLTIPNNLPQGRYSLAAILDYPGSASLKGTQIIIDAD